jgi:hypothetical protein
VLSSFFSALAALGEAKLRAAEDAPDPPPRLETDTSSGSLGNSNDLQLCGS